MSDPDLDLSSLEAQLAALDEPMRTWRGSRQRAFSMTFERKTWRPSALMSRLPRAAAGAMGVRAAPHEAVFALLDGVTEAYARSDAQRCALIRGVIHDHEAARLLEEYVAHAARVLGQGGRAEWLDRGLAAASIGDQRRDASDWLSALGDLYLSARKAHIDPTPAFQRMAERSNRDGHAAARVSTREVLAGFEQSAYFETSILPHLR